MSNFFVDEHFSKYLLPCFSAMSKRQHRLESSDSDSDVPVSASDVPRNFKSLGLSFTCKATCGQRLI